MLAERGIPIKATTVPRRLQNFGPARRNRELKTSKKHPQHRFYPSLLKGLFITRTTQVWRTDISHIPMRRGFL